MTPVSHTAGPDDIMVQVTLMPHRSLGQRGFKHLMVFLLIITGFACLRFFAVGAWPVILFVAVDIWAIWFAFSLNYHRAKEREIVTLTKRALIIDKISPSGTHQRETLEPYWSRFELAKVNEDANQLVVRCRDQSISLGSFLPPVEREGLVTELRDHLQRWRAGALTV